MPSKVSKHLRSGDVVLATMLLATAAIGYLVLARGYNEPLMIPDEFGYLTVAAYLAGYDWSAVTHALPWYSFGYSLLLAPLFAVAEPAHWYKMAQLLNIGLVACTVPMMVAVLRRTGPEAQAKATSWLAASIVVLYPSVFFYAKLAAAETLIFVTPWVSALLLARAVRNNVRWIDAAFLGAATAAMYFIHSRLLGTMAAVVACAGLFSLLRGRTLALAGGFASGAIPTILAGQIFKEYLIQNLYLGQLSGVQHSLTSMTELVWGRLSWSSLHTLFGVLSGHLTYVMVSSFGIAFIGLWWAAIKVYRDRPYLADNSTILPFFFMLNLAFTVAISAIALAVPVFPHHVFYGRYIEPALMPMVALGVVALLEGEIRWRWVWVAGVLTFALLAPAAVKLAATLPAKNTYWILMTGLFSFRAPDWTLNLSSLAFGLFGALLLLTAAWRLGRLSGVSAVALLFSLTSLNVVSTFAFGSESWRYKYTAYRAEVVAGQAKIGYLVHDSNFMRGEVQFYNPETKVIPLTQWDPAVNGEPIELIDSSGGNIRHRWCGASGVGTPACTALTPSPLKERVRIGWPDSPVALGAMKSSSTRIFLQKLSAWPFLRAFGLNPTDVRQRVVLSTDADRQGSYVLVTFITPQDQPEKWLADRREVVVVPAGQSKVTVTTSIPLRGYDGTPLAPGRYSAHWVVAHPDGYDWSTHAALPLSVK